MKKVFYILLIAFATSLSISACTEEQVEPQTTSGGGVGGGASEPGA